MTKKEGICWILIFTFFTILSLNRHSKAPIFTYNSEIWADKAGYNVYLPALFIYKFEATHFPDSIEYKTGNGFELNRETNKIITKYPYGTALLQSPFWFVAHLIDKEKTGYSEFYNKSIDVAAVFYFVLGLFFLYRLLNIEQRKKTAFLTLVLSIFGTNLFYYAIFETGMSHIYSFACFSMLLYLLSQNRFDYQIILLSLIILVVRPINIVFLIPIVFLFDVSSKSDFFERIKVLFTRKNIVLGVTLAVVVLLPQLLYNQYAQGTWSINAYQNETFMYWNNPKIFEVLFAPTNGLFLYAPMLAIVFVALALKVEMLKRFAYLPILLLLIYTITYASWWSYMLGCGLGHRGLVDILPIFIYMVYHIIKATDSKVFYALAILCSLYTTKLSFSYDGCFPGKGDWDWQAYKAVVLEKTK